ncbi:hypothetical protein [Roseibium sp.]|uniref:hypothetical protein n=1 Tax=Roseibium sp. TaxID=1936156 RepID=UPI003A984597
MLNQFIKLAAIAGACLLLAACQTAGLKPGSIQSTYAPTGWERVNSGRYSGYACKRPTCKSDQAVVTIALGGEANLEAAIKSGELSKELANAIFNVDGVASKGTRHLKFTRKIITKDYSGFDVSGYLKTPKGKLSIEGRVFVQKNRSTGVASYAFSRKLARSNLRQYLARTSVRRLP